MTPQLLEVFAEIMGELQGLIDELDEHGPTVARRCLESAADPRRDWGRRPLAMSPDLAKVVRSRVDDALVRRLERAT